MLGCDVCFFASDLFYFVRAGQRIRTPLGVHLKKRPMWDHVRPTIVHRAQWLTTKRNCCLEIFGKQNINCGIQTQNFITHYSWRYVHDSGFHPNVDVAIVTPVYPLLNLVSHLPVPCGAPWFYVALASPIKNYMLHPGSEDPIPDTTV